MNACQSLSAVLIAFATLIFPCKGIGGQTQDAPAAEEATFTPEVAPNEKTASVGEVDSDEIPETEIPNPFVPATSPHVETEEGEPTETTPAAAEAVPTEPVTTEPIPPAHPIEAHQSNPSPIVTPEEIIAPIAEEVVLPIAQPSVITVPSVQPEIFFDSPAPSQSDRRIAKDKVAELRQQRALYRANQRMARMEYNQWMGREPLRPRWSPMPMMNSRYAPPTIVVPVFINPR